MGGSHFHKVFPAEEPEYKSHDDRYLIRSIQALPTNHNTAVQWHTCLHLELRHAAVTGSGWSSLEVARFRQIPYLRRGSPHDPQNKLLANSLQYTTVSTSTCLLHNHTIFIRFIEGSYKNYGA